LSQWILLGAQLVDQAVLHPHAAAWNRLQSGLAETLYFITKDVLSDAVHTGRIEKASIYTALSSLGHQVRDELRDYLFVITRDKVFK
jgi:hypothetical protein